jgi:hypothetical protein
VDRGSAALLNQRRSFFFDGSYNYLRTLRARGVQQQQGKTAVAGDETKLGAGLYWGLHGGLHAVTVYQGMRNRPLRQKSAVIRPRGRPAPVVIAAVAVLSALIRVNPR